MFRKRSLGSKPVSSDDLYICLRPILKFGQIIGICPYTGLWSRQPEKFPVFKAKSIVVIPSLLIIFLMTVNVLINLIGMARKIMSGQSSPIQISWAIQLPMLYSVSLYTYVHHIRHGETLCSLLVKWSTCRQMSYVGQVDKRVRWRILFWAGFVMTSAILENVVYHLRYDCMQSNCRHLGEKNLTELETYYWREHGENWVRIPYNPIVAVLLFFVNKLTIMSTNYTDITIISMAWALSSKFKQFIQQVSHEIENKTVSWTLVRKDFVILHEIFQGISHFLSPLIFASYTLLLELISTQIHLGITTDTNRSTMEKIYSAWSFIHLIVRLLLLSLVSSGIMERGQEILYLIQKCPSEKYNNEVERLERLVTSPICLTGLDCFKQIQSPKTETGIPMS